MSRRDELRSRLVDLQAAVFHVWSAYKDVGPGRVDAQLFDGGAAAAAHVLELLGDEDISATITADTLRAAIKKACDLAVRCATRPEGLCFITGEAGLVPRRDWHAAMDDSLAVIADALAAIEDGEGGGA